MSIINVKLGIFIVNEFKIDGTYSVRNIKDKVNQYIKDNGIQYNGTFKATDINEYLETYTVNNRVGKSQIKSLYIKSAKFKVIK